MLLLSGCSSPKPASSANPVPSPKESETPESVRRVVESGKFKLESTNSAGKTVWILNGEAVRAGLEESGNNEFFVTTATGEIYTDGEVASTFTADEAKASTETKKLVLDQNVMIKSNSQKLTLKADKITWMEERQLFAASGNVKIDSKTWQLGDMPEVWATPDLSKIGSPNKFK